LIPPTSPRTTLRTANQDNLVRSAKLARNLHSLLIARAFAMARFAIGLECYYRAAPNGAIGRALAGQARSSRAA